MGVLLACMSVHCKCAWCPRMSEEALNLLELELRTVVSCCVGAEAGTLGPLGEQQVLLTTKSSPCFFCLFLFVCLFIFRQISWCNPDCPGTGSVTHVLGLRVCTITPSSINFLAHR